MKSSDILIVIFLTAEISLSVGYLLAKWANLGRLDLDILDLIILPILCYFWADILWKNRKFLF